MVACPTTLQIRCRSGAYLATPDVEPDNDGMGSAARPLLLLALCACVVDVGVGCATPQASQEQRDTRRLRALERSFHAFTATKLKDFDDVETATTQLEQLRMDYLDALSDTSSAEKDQLLALLRLAELHLDLGARVRRVPYPAHLDERQQRQFDVRLSALALPLEATGQGILEQIVQRADRDGVDGRFVHRARLYLHLHAHKGDVLLDDDDVAVLRQELVAQTFRAPRSLLEAGRVGQRAARR